MKTPSVLLLLTLCSLIACNKSGPPPAPSAPASSASSSSKTPDAVQEKLREYSGASATDCGRLDVHATADQSKAASDCAMQANQAKHAFYVAYDMPGMTIGVAGNEVGQTFSVQNQGGGALTAGACPSQLRVAASGRVTCFAPGDMGSMGGGHTAIPPGMPNPHAIPKTK